MNLLYTIFNFLVIPIISVHTGYEDEILLSAASRPYYTFTLSSATENAYLRLWSYNSANFPSEEFMISVAIESMTCSPEKGTLLIENGNRTSVSVCHNVNNTENNFEAVKDIFDGETEVRITTQGNWRNMKANLVATVYYETVGNCDTCDEKFYCCDNPNSQCNSRYSHHEGSYYKLSKVRCIPNYGYSKGSRKFVSSVCDGHPNCGRFCNSDESKTSCEEAKYNNIMNVDPCTENPDCIIGFGGLQLTFVILGIFVLISLLYVFIMLSPTLRKLFGISLLFPNNRNRQEDEDDENNSIDTNSARSVFVYVNTLNIATVSCQDNDLPPRYDELELEQRNKKQQRQREETNNADLDLPSFTEAVNFEYRDFSQIASSSGNGIVNPAYENYISDSQSQDSQRHRSDKDKY